jgi:predicted amidophosphoribosyltransferase
MTDFILVVVIGIGAIVAVITAKDAGKRGMNEFGWGVGVFLAMIFFLPLYLIVRKPVLRTVIEQEQLESGNARKCPYCAEIIRAGAQVCRFCGRELVDVGGGPRSAGLLEHLETLPSVCSTCGAEIRNSQGICVHCASRVNAAS